MNTSLFTPLSRTVVAAAAMALVAGAANAANLPFDATAGTVDVDATALAGAGVTVTALGGATYSNALLTLPVAAVSTSVDGGSATIDFGDADGFILNTAYGKITFKDFSFDFASGTLFGDLQGTGLLASVSYLDGGLITAGTYEGNLGTDSLAAVSPSAASRPLYLSATSFTVAAGLVSYLEALELSSNVLPVGQVVKNLNIGTAPPAVPEPASLALMAGGMLAVVAMRRRKL